MRSDVIQSNAFKMYTEEFIDQIWICLLDLKNLVVHLCQFELSDKNIGITTTWRVLASVNSFKKKQTSSH